MSSPEETNTGPVIRDLRRIDPATGQVRDPGQGRPAHAAPDRGEGPQRGSAKSRPGRHAASRPGGTGGKPGRPEAPRAQAAQADASTAGEARPAGSGTDARPAPGPAGANEAEAAAEDVATALAERTADLQRVTAEYANYRKRVERDRLAVREQALTNVLSSLLPVLDDIGRAREHGELVGGFKSVAESFESVVTKLGLTSFGEEGESFDPKVHEALMHSYSADVAEPTCVTILQPGYKVGERILRPARVAVAEPAQPGGGAGEDEGASSAVPGQAEPATSDQADANGQ